MFNVIEPQEHHLYKSSIDLFLQELHVTVDLEQSQDLTQATYILVEEDLENLQGGILLLKQSAAAIVPALRTYLKVFDPFSTSRKKIWTGRLAFQMSETLSARDFEKISKLLYRILYEYLIVFGIKENTSFLCLTMPLIEHLSINLLGLWPYRLEVSPPLSSDGLFHGILSLAGTMPSSSNVCQPEGKKVPFALQYCDKIITF